MAESGLVPRLLGMVVTQERWARTALAQRLFVTRTDREAMLVLLAALTGRNLRDAQGVARPSTASSTASRWKWG